MFYQLIAKEVNFAYLNESEPFPGILTAVVDTPVNWEISAVPDTEWREVYGNPSITCMPVKIYKV